MPKRVIDFDAMWGSDKLASCAEWAQAEYAWLYGLADASGCFELTNLRVIWGRVAAIRRNLTIERLEQIFGEFQDKGLLFVWEHEGKRYGHWTGSDVPGRLPAPSWRMRLERLAPPVPKAEFGEYVSRFARGRAVLAGGESRFEAGRESLKNKCESSDLKFQSSSAGTAETSREISPHHSDSFLPLNTNLKNDFQRERPDSHECGALPSLKGRLEEGQAQDWNSERNKEREGNLRELDHGVACGPLPASQAELPYPLSQNEKSNSQNHGTAPQARPPQREANRVARTAVAGAGQAWTEFRSRDKALLLERELLVGRGPCGPVKVKPEALERIRARDALRRGSRSP